VIRETCLPQFILLLITLDIVALKDKLLPVNFIGMNINVKAIYIAPFLSGHRVMVDIGWVAPKDLKHDLGKQEPITLAFKDYNGTVH
jgi:hypothetical protein